MRAYLGAGIVLPALYAAFKLKKNVSSIFIGIKFSVVNCIYLVPKWSICVSLIYVRGKKNIYVYICVCVCVCVYTHTHTHILRNVSFLKVKYHIIIYSFLPILSQHTKLNFVLVLFNLKRLILKRKETCYIVFNIFWYYN